MRDFQGDNSQIVPSSGLPGPGKIFNKYGKGPSVGTGTTCALILSFVLLRTTNIFDIRIRSAVRLWKYSIFVFGKIFQKNVLIYRQAAKIIGYLHKYAPKLIQNLLFGGGGSSKVCILYIQYLYFLRMSIFDICIR